MTTAFRSLLTPSSPPKGKGKHNSEYDHSFLVTAHPRRDLMVTSCTIVPAEYDHSFWTLLTLGYRPIGRDLGSRGTNDGWVILYPSERCRIVGLFHKE